MIINGRPIGPGHPVYVIAEVGSNHDQELKKALRFIDECAASGADAVKFQVFSADTLVNPLLRPHFHQVLQKCDLQREWLPTLCARAEEKGVDFLATPFDLAAVRTLQELDVPAIKIASGDLTNVPLLRAAAATGKPIIASTGMAYVGEIEKAVHLLKTAGAMEVAVLHCVGAYPAAEKDVNLRVIPLLRQLLCVPVGFSDHTLGLGAPVAAVALGACIIEKHVTFDRSGEGPDHSFALEIGEFSRMIKLIREAEVAIGDARKRLGQNELESRQRARRGIYARASIPTGARIAEEMIIALRPKSGIDAAAWDDIIGRVALRDIHPYESLSWSMFRE